MTCAYTAVPATPPNMLCCIPTPLSGCHGPDTSQQAHYSTAHTASMHVTAPRTPPWRQAKRYAYTEQCTHMYTPCLPTCMAHRNLIIMCMTKTPSCTSASTLVTCVCVCVCWRMHAVRPVRKAVATDQLTTDLQQCLTQHACI